MKFTDWLLLSAACAAGVYLLFVAAPGVCSFFFIFGRRRVVPFRELDLHGHYLLPYRDVILAGCDRLDAVPSSTVSITADDGIELNARFFDTGSDACVILIHGFTASPECNFAVLAADLLDRGYSVLMPVNRAHTGSGGRYTTLGLAESEDVLRWTEYAEDTLHKHRLVVYGMSMGCAAVSYSSDRLNPACVRGLCLDCGFSSPAQQMTDDMKKRHLPVRLLSPIVRLCGRVVLKRDLSVPVGDSLARCRIPALFIHGTGDESVPFEQGQRNYAACGAPKQALFVEGANHTVSYLAGGEGAKNTVLGFISDRLGQEKENNT